MALSAKKFIFSFCSFEGLGSLKTRTFQFLPVVYLPNITIISNRNQAVHSHTSSWSNLNLVFCSYALFKFLIFNFKFLAISNFGTILAFRKKCSFLILVILFIRVSWDFKSVQIPTRANLATIATILTHNQVVHIHKS